MISRRQFIKRLGIATSIAVLSFTHLAGAPAPLQQSTPIRWSYLLGPGNQSKVHTDASGSIWVDADAGVLSYTGQRIEGDFDLVYSIDSRFPPSHLGVVFDPPTGQSSGTYITIWSGDPAFINPESASEINRRYKPGDQFMLSRRCGKLEYYFNGELWWVSTQPTLPQGLKPIVQFGGVGAAQAAIGCRIVKPRE